MELRSIACLFCFNLSPHFTLWSWFFNSVKGSYTLWPEYVPSPDEEHFFPVEEYTTTTKVCMKNIFRSGMPASLMLHYFVSMVETNLSEASDVFQLIVQKACILLPLFQVGMIRLLCKDFRKSTDSSKILRWIRNWNSNYCWSTNIQTYL